MFSSNGKFNGPRNWRNDTLGAFPNCAGANPGRCTQFRIPFANQPVQGFSGAPPGDVSCAFGFAYANVFGWDPGKCPWEGGREEPGRRRGGGETPMRHVRGQRMSACMCMCVGRETKTGLRPSRVDTHAPFVQHLLQVFGYIPDKFTPTPSPAPSLLARAHPRPSVHHHHHQASRRSAARTARPRASSRS